MAPIEIAGIASPIVLVVTLYYNVCFASLCYIEYTKVAKRIYAYVLALQ